jgi:hypothetical protein
MPLSWNEIKSRAATFSKKWEQETSEDAESKSFWDDFFNIFDISRYRVASFEKAVSLTPTFAEASVGKPNPSPQAARGK